MNLSKTFRIALIAPALLAMGTTYAQQSSLYTMYMWNQLIINPAYAGSVDAVSASLVSRHQWVGLDGAPSTQVLSIHSPLPNDNMGIGLTVENDRIGPTNNTGIWGDFSYSIQTSEKAKLSFGLRAGVAIFQANLRDLDNIDPNDQAFVGNVENRLLPNFGFGAYYRSDRGYVGLAAPTTLEPELNTFSVQNTNSRGVDNRHYYVLAGYVFNLSADSGGVMFKPSTIVRLVEGAPVSFDFSAMFLIQQKFWIGGAYRYQDSFAGILSMNVNQHLQVGYSYDFGTNNLNSYHNGSHEIMLTYDFFKPDIKVRSPRYF
jgi:type IX secretion system PorP/SprF family membrane protein